MSNATLLRLEGELTIYTASDVRQRLLAALSGDAAATVLQLDLTGVTETDTAGMQLLLAARQYARAHQREVRISGVGGCVATAIQLLGLDDAFADACAETAVA
jgi:anti-anti-sigma factor